MARLETAEWTGEKSPRVPMDEYDIVCVHTIVGYAPAHAAHFSTRWDGSIIQSRDTKYRSAANLHGNPRVIAIENEDHGRAFGGTPRLPNWVALTDAQVTACAEILAFAHLEHGVPLQLCPDSRPGSRGLAYHRQGVKGNWLGYKFKGWIRGGEVWSTSRGKVCPTDIRIAQLPEILRQAKAIVAVKDPNREVPSVSHVANFRNACIEAERILGAGLVELDKASPTRKVAKRQRAVVAGLRATLRGVIRITPVA